MYVETHFLAPESAGDTMMRDEKKGSVADMRVDKGFSAWRLDDNNNEFLVRDGMTEEEVLALVREYEGKGHRQAYWVKRGSREG
jgi:hypothetical protein